MFIIMVGALGTGFTCVGPFETRAAADEYATRNINAGYAQIFRVEKPFGR